MRWVGWKRVTAGNPFGDGTIDNQIERRLTQHAVEGNVGGYRDQGHGEAGRALCGTKVPADDASFIAWWDVRPDGRHCKRCERTLKKRNAETP